MNRSIIEYTNSGERASSVLCANYLTLLDFITSALSAYLHESTGEQPSFEILDQVIER